MSSLYTHLDAAQMGSYLSTVQIRNALKSMRVHETEKVCVMSLEKFERLVDRAVPVFLLSLGLIAAFGTAALSA
jgi:hypothetical protein